MKVNLRDSNLPHIKWCEIQAGSGIEEEVCVMRIDPSNGDVYFFSVGALDATDRQRLIEIERMRNANLYEMWDLMKNHTLRNGVNALEYFHQLVQVRTVTGRVIDPNVTRRGGVALPQAAVDAITPEEKNRARKGNSKE